MFYYVRNEVLYKPIHHAWLSTRLLRFKWEEIDGEVNITVTAVSMCMLSRDPIIVQRMEYNKWCVCLYHLQHSTKEILI